ncbi:serine carboxypeptidase-like 35 [Gastrolobium bilobum]|uniref:serine carboxypeptidase-like 35 n=1 Tax=Gastrolobium bilobum TaxID=150636 RepID=UPI002AAF625A|nr:serine carboxypeptidase-like 35 [Gastrolobium bilobum]
MSIFWNLLFYCLLTTVSTGREYSGKETPQQEADRVKNLPGQPPVKFRHYAGYVKLRPHEEKALFYWFFEAQEAPSQKPLLLWLNGGPGCSSIGYGAARELGPFLVKDKERLKLNKFSWNRAANIIFLESPVGVGFSYTNNSKDLQELGDRVTAIDNYAFLIGWFKRFPSFRSHDFYIAGESYAGHYVPQLAEVIYEGNKDTKKGSYINLKGFMVGNAVMNDVTDVKGIIDYAWSHAIISDQEYYGIVKDCDFSKENKSKACEMRVGGLLEAYSEIDIYSIYSPICISDYQRAVSAKLLVAPHLLTSHDLWHTLPAGYDPCTEDYIDKYFNNEDVQKALHANITNLSYPYTLCSAVIRKWNDSPNTVLPVIKKLLHAGLRIWIYSGDTDGRVPVTSTRYSINKMDLKIRKEWRAWFHKKQVAGWMEVYEGGLTFATIRGAGHQVPVLAPEQSLSLFTHFLSSHTLPSSRF